MKRKLLSVFLVTSMVLSLTACGSKENGQTGSADEKQETSAEKENDSKAAEGEQESAAEQQDEVVDPFAPYEETVTLKVAHLANNTITWPEGDDVKSNAWTRAYKELYNIELDYVIFEESSEYETKINLAMAENNLPDVFKVTAAQLDQLMEADLLYDLTDIWETYAFDELKEYAAGDEITFSTAFKDGRMYAIPRFDSGYLSQTELLWIRKDWKEALNLEDPETMDDVAEIARAFMDEYGAEYGIGTANTLDELLYLAPAWGAYHDFWLEDENGQIVYGSVQPEMKNALAQWAQWYQEGLISANFATIDREKLQEDTVNNKVGLYGNGQTWGWFPGPDMVETNGVDSAFEPYLIPTATGQEVLYPYNCNNDGYIVVNKNCEHPEAIFKMLKLHDLVRYDQEFAVNEPEMKAELFDDMRQHWPQVYRVFSNTFEQGILYQLQDAVAAGSGDGLSGDAATRYEECRKWLEDGDKSGLGRYSQLLSFTIADEILTSDRDIYNKVWGINTETMKQSGSVLKDLLIEGFTKIIMGDKPVDYFDELVESWNKAGGEQMTKEVNDYYAN